MILYIANRGEIALRVLKTAKRLGWKTAVGYANQDVEMPFVRSADIQISLDGEEASETYLNIEKVLAAAKKANATHIHPGYGFLSENSKFVEAVQAAKIEFVGPNPEAMRLLGDKIGSRKFLAQHKIPLLPAYNGDDQDEQRLLKEADSLGYPILIKPSAGGGGKGMMRVTCHEDFLPALQSSKRVARSAFNDDRVFLEKLVTPARHIEVQILGDKQGNVKAFGERECSLQRRHQKVFEETPCVYLSQKLRDRIIEGSVRIAKEAKYHSAGTVEWIWDGADGIYFLEVNARLQVEHPVTEMVWDVDLVEWQLRVATGESVKNVAHAPKGHAIEARLCAEDPREGFLPSAGKIHRLLWPQDVRIDAGFYEKNTVPSQFDSLLAKVIAFGTTRTEALDRLRAALEATVLFGPKTNRAYLIQVLSDSRVIEGNIHTLLLGEIEPRFDMVAALQMIRETTNATDLDAEDDDLDFDSPWGSIPRPRRDVVFEDFSETRYFYTKFADWTAASPQKRKRSASASTMENYDSQLKSPMPAKVIKVLVSSGEKVAKGQTVVVLEAMKMEHQLKASSERIVKKIFVKEGERVAHDATLVEWEESK